MCSDSKFAAILLQHIKGAKTLERSMNDPHFVRNHLMNVLYQIYFPLSVLKDEFTHYDLHASNVLMYEPYVGKHIRYHYHIDGQVITFDSPYVAKIIDYGKSFFNTETLKPKDIYEKLCVESQCSTLTTTCGYSFGFPFDTRKPPSFYADSLVPNQSHDLKLVHQMISDRRVKLFAPIELLELLKNIVYGKGLPANQANHGTEPAESTLFSPLIYNVKDIEKTLRNLVKGKELQTVKMGDLHIYKDGSPMRFE